MTDMAPSPVITVGSVEMPALARDTIRLVVHGRVRRPARLRLTVLVAPDVLVDPVAGPGLRVGVSCGVSLDVQGARVALFDGAVTALTLRAPADGPPVVVIDAEETLPSGPPVSRSSGVSLRYGQDLVSVRVRTDLTARSDGARTRVVGETLGMPTLGLGSTVTLAGVGAYVDGRALRVTAVRQVFDLERGLRTRFRARAAG